MRDQLHAKPKRPRPTHVKKVRTQFPTALPGLLTQHITDRAGGSPVKVCAHDETRLGLLPIIRLGKALTEEQ